MDALKRRDVTSGLVWLLRAVAIGFVLCPLLLASTARAATGHVARTKIAVLPFCQQGQGYATEDMGRIVSEWLITAIVKEGRFEVIERRLLGQILEEQKMVETGVVTQETASEIGRILGVTAIISGSVMKLQDVIEVNARIVDVATASILFAENVKARDVTKLQDGVAGMAGKIIGSFPLNGVIVNREEKNVVLDLGEAVGVKNGMHFIVYEEGEDVKHPKTGEILYRKQKRVGVIKVTGVQRKCSEGIIVEEVALHSVKYGNAITSVPAGSDRDAKTKDSRVEEGDTRGGKGAAQLSGHPSEKRVLPSARSQANARSKTRTVAANSNCRNLLKKWQLGDVLSMQRYKLECVGR